MNTQPNHSNTARYSRILFAALLMVGLVLNSGLPFGLSTAPANAAPANAANIAQVQPTVSPGAEEGILHAEIIGNGTSGEGPSAGEGTVVAPTNTPRPTYTPDVPTTVPTAVPPTKTPTAVPVTPSATPMVDPAQVRICHATGSSSNPYNSISYARQDVIGGHMGHGDDIVPPFTSAGVSYSKNWTPQGQAIWANSCSPAAQTMLGTPVVVTTNNCSYTTAYWKTHQSVWPVKALTIGGLSFSQERLLTILNTPQNGDPSYAVFTKLVAALLSVAHGTDSAVVQATIQAAQAWLSDNPLNSNPTGAAATKGNAYAATLDNYNNGLIGPGHCADDTNVLPALQPVLQPVGTKPSKPVLPTSALGPQTNATALPGKSKPVLPTSALGPQTNATVVPGSGSPSLNPAKKPTDTPTPVPTATPDLAATAAADAIAIERKITLCHATASESNPYVEINVSINSVENAISVHGHGDHTGGIFPAQNWGDIIPPFDWNYKHDSVHFPGLNWTEAGQAMWGHGCAAPETIKTLVTDVPVPTATNTPQPLPPTPSNPSSQADYNWTCKTGIANDSSSNQPCGKFHGEKWEKHDGNWYMVNTFCQADDVCANVAPPTPKATEESSNEPPCTQRLTPGGLVIDCTPKDKGNPEIKTWNLHAELDTACPINQVLRSPYPRTMVNMTTTFSLQAPDAASLNGVSSILVSPDNLSEFIDAQGNPTETGYKAGIWKNLQLSMRSRRLDGGVSWYGQSVPQPQWTFNDRAWNTTGPFPKTQQGAQATYVFQTASAGLDTKFGRAYDGINKVPANTYNLPAYGASIMSFCGHEWFMTYQTAARTWQPSGACYQTELYPDGTTLEPEGTSSMSCDPGWVAPGQYAYKWVDKLTTWAGVNMTGVGKATSYDVRTRAKSGGTFNGTQYWDETTGVWVPVVEVQSVLRDECVASGKCEPPKAP